MIYFKFSSKDGVFINANDPKPIYIIAENSEQQRRIEKAISDNITALEIFIKSLKAAKGPRG